MSFEQKLRLQIKAERVKWTCEPFITNSAKNFAINRSWLQSERKFHQSKQRDAAIGALVMRTIRPGAHYRLSKAKDYGAL